MVTMLGQMCSGCKCFIVLRLEGHSHWQNGHYASPTHVQHAAAQGKYQGVVVLQGISARVIANNLQSLMRVSQDLCSSTVT